MNTWRDAPQPQAGERKPAPAKRILLVDDHPLLRAGLVGLIHGQPDLTVCREASTAAEALDAIERCVPDLVVTDLAMPGKGGLELIKDLNALYPDVPVLVLSMQDELLHAERVLRAGGRGYLMKEAGAEKMLEAIRRVLAGEIFVSQRMSARIMDLFSGRRAHNSPVQILTDREFEVFQLIGQGRTTKDIALELHLSSKTVDAHRGHIKAKLGLFDAAGLVRHAVRWVETENSRPG